MRALLLTALLITSAAIAADQSEIDWIKLHIITAGDDDPAVMIQEMKYRGFSDEGAQALIEYVARGKQTLDELGKEQHQAMCARRAELADDPEKFAQHIEQMSAVYGATRKGLVDNVGIVLSPVDDTNLSEMMRHMPDPSFFETNASFWIRSGRLDVKATLERGCGKEKREAA